MAPTKHRPWFIIYLAVVSYVALCLRAYTSDDFRFVAAIGFITLLLGYILLLVRALSRSDSFRVTAQRALAHPVLWFFLGFSILWWWRLVFFVPVLFYTYPGWLYCLLDPLDAPYMLIINIGRFLSFGVGISLSLLLGLPTDKARRRAQPFYAFVAIFTASYVLPWALVLLLNLALGTFCWVP